MEAHLALTPIWKPIYTLPQGTPLEAYTTALQAATATIPDSYLCYAWTSGSIIHYVGSITRDWRAGHGRHNLRARVAAYLGSKMSTNVRIRRRLAATLPTQDVTLGVLRFDVLHFGAELVLVYAAKPLT